jgi:hypothetical protein
MRDKAIDSEMRIAPIRPNEKLAMRGVLKRDQDDLAQEIGEHHGLHPAQPHADHHAPEDGGHDHRDPNPDHSQLDPGPAFIVRHRFQRIIFQDLGFFSQCPIVPLCQPYDDITPR